MPNLINRLLMEEIERDLDGMGSCLVLSFDRLTVAAASDLRTKFREAGVRYRVVKNRLAIKAFEARGLDMADAFEGKCGLVLAPEEGAIGAAKIVREAFRRAKEPPVRVTGGVIEGEPIVGPAARHIADMPDKNTVRSQLLGVLTGLHRGLLTCVQSAGPAGVARVLQARIDKEEGGGD